MFIGRKRFLITMPCKIEIVQSLHGNLVRNLIIKFQVDESLFAQKLLMAN